MMDAELFLNKITEIERRMDYVIDNWEHGEEINVQEIRFVLSAYLHGVYKRKKVRKLAETYIQRIKEKRRLDFETTLAALAAAFIVGKDFSEYWNNLKEKINKSSPREKPDLIVQLLTIITPNSIKKLEDNIQYIKTLLNNLRKQNTKKKLFSHWIGEYLFSEEEKITVNLNEIKYLSDYLLWELVNLEDNYQKKNEIREKFIPEILNYKVNRIDWVTFLIYQFLKRNKPIIITEIELNRKIKHEVKFAISKKVWFPLISSVIFMSVKLYTANTMNLETIIEVIMLILGTSFLFFEERLPSFEIPVKRGRMTFGQIGEFLIIASILWALNLISLLPLLFP